jgi:hypothetical protein
VDRHHVLKRSAMGKDTIQLCRACHEWVETHPREAEELGLHIPFYKSKSYKEKYGKRRN